MLLAVHNKCSCGIEGGIWTRDQIEVDKADRLGESEVFSCALNHTSTSRFILDCSKSKEAELLIPLDDRAQPMEISRFDIGVIEAIVLSGNGIACLLNFVQCLTTAIRGRKLLGNSEER